MQHSGLWALMANFNIRESTTGPSTDDGGGVHYSSNMGASNDEIEGLDEDDDDDDMEEIP